MILANGKTMDRIDDKILTVHRLLLELVLLQRLQSLRREAEIIQFHICKTVINNVTYTDIYFVTLQLTASFAYILLGFAGLIQ